MRVSEGRMLLDALTLEQVEPTSFRSVAGTGEWPRLYGGEVAAQAVMAAGRTVPEGRPLHSVHTYFLLPGDSSRPVYYRVRVERDGGSYSNRSVAAYQEGQVIFTMAASFAAPRTGVTHQAQSLNAPAPENVPHAAVTLAENPSSLRWIDMITSRFPVEMRFPDGLNSGAGSPRERAWIRSVETLPHDPLVQAAAIVYLSDLLLLSSALAAHRVALDELAGNVATVDHSVWLHAPQRADDWFMYEVASDWAGGGRALCRGRMFDRHGALFASSAQEGTIRIP